MPITPDVPFQRALPAPVHYYYDIERLVPGPKTNTYYCMQDITQAYFTPPARVVTILVTTITAGVEWRSRRARRRVRKASSHPRTQPMPIATRYAPSIQRIPPFYEYIVDPAPDERTV